MQYCIVVVVVVSLMNWNGIESNVDLYACRYVCMYILERISQIEFYQFAIAIRQNCHDDTVYLMKIFIFMKTKSLWWKM